MAFFYVPPNGGAVLLQSFLLDIWDLVVFYLYSLSAAGSIMFHVRRRPQDHGPRKRKKKPLKGSGGTLEGGADSNQLSLPLLVELGPGKNYY